MIVDISILITCFEKEKYLEDCVASILRQTKQPKEIILVHDGCESASTHLHTDTIILKDNRGVVNARHQAFRFSTGSLILFVDGDDVLSPDYLEKMTYLIGTTETDIAYPDMYMWSGNDSKLVVTPEQITPQFVQDFSKVVIPVTCLMKREVYEKLEGFQEWPVLEDVDFWIRAMAKGFKFSKAQTLLWYRRYPGTRNTLDIEKRKAVMKQILNQFKFKNGEVKYGEN